MSDTPTTERALEVHDPEILRQARAVLEACRSGQELQAAVMAAVKGNETWRGQQCINLLAPEAPTRPAVRTLLSAQVGTRAAEGHIGRVNRRFAGTQYIDELEALCVELLKQASRARYADHRLVASMIGNLAVYTALTEPGDVIMSIAQPFGGHSSNRLDGPAGVRGLSIVDVPMDPAELVVDLGRPDVLWLFLDASAYYQCQPFADLLGGTSRQVLHEAAMFSTLATLPLPELAEHLGELGLDLYRTLSVQTTCTQFGPFTFMAEFSANTDSVGLPK